MFRQSNLAKYEPLPSPQDESTKTLLEHPSGDALPLSKYRLPAYLRWTIAAVVVVSLIDVFSVFYLAHANVTVFRAKDFTSKLEYADAYMGLKEMYSSGRTSNAKIQSILMRPALAAQVYPNEPRKLAPRGERDYSNPTGARLSPNERRLHVTPDTHTIVQFRAIDFGMEACTLAFDFPAPGVQLEDGAVFDLRPASRFDVFRLAANSNVDAKQLSYASRPAVVNKVATIEAHLNGRTTILDFPCPSMSLHVFEIACAEWSECFVDAWTSHNTSHGVIMLQHQTI